MMDKSCLVDVEERASVWRRVSSRSGRFGRGKKTTTQSFQVFPGKYVSVCPSSSARFASELPLGGLQGC